MASLSAKPEEDASAAPAQADSPAPGDAPETSVAAEPVAEADETATDGSGSEGEVDESDAAAAPPLPSEAVPSDPPLPNESIPEQDDGWDCLWDAHSQAWFFSNRFTGQTQWENPRVSTVDAVAAAPGTEPAAAPLPPAHEKPIAGGYNPAVHGDYDPTAWYAQPDATDPSLDPQAAAAAVIDPYAATATFNRFTGQFQAGEGADRHTDEAKSRRQMNAFFDVDAAANSHDGRSLKAERSNKKPSKHELKAFKEKRKARKEEKRRAWLRD